jgi:hypothetical protein
MKTKSRSIALAVAGFLLLGIGGVLGATEPSHELLFVAAGFIAYLLCVARALTLWKLDDQVFASRPRS